jgi:hypothetical protein
MREDANSTDAWPIIHKKNGKDKGKSTAMNFLMKGIYYAKVFVFSIQKKLSCKANCKNITQ